VTVIVSRSEADTIAAGRDLGRTLSPGDVVLLEGQLGAGKTAFVRGLAEGAGVPPDDVSSPTFTIVQEYRGTRATLQHVDLYRLSAKEVDDLALDDIIEGSIAAVEWPDRWADPPPGSARVRIDVVDGESRRITIGTSPHDRPSS
jgi:tRNA threonylcarbamoyladenosine biosynthesis protein TsaE